MTRVFAASTIVAWFALVSAQNVSPGCLDALKSIATNPDASGCLTPAPLLGLAAGDNTSIVVPINQWLNSLCAAGPCSNSTLEFIVNTALDGCAAELALVGYNTNMKSGVLSTIQQVYPTVRQAICMKERNDNCVTKTLTLVEASTGSLSISKVVQLAQTGFSNTTIPKEALCSNCTKAQFNTLNKIPGVFDEGSKDVISKQCGASFVDGETPPGISSSAVTASSNNKNNAAYTSAFPGFVATYALFVLGNIFMAA